MNENTTDVNKISLYAQLEALYASLEMHVKRSEAIALQIQRLQKELEDEPQEKTE